MGWVDEKVFGQVFVGFSSFPALTLLEVGDVLGGEGDADAVHLGSIPLELLGSLHDR